MIPEENIDLILHIGMPKTGSSAIQKFCIENQNLLKKNGYYYPHHELDANGVSGGHDQLYTILESGDTNKLDSLISGYVEKAKRKNQTLLLSNEGCHLFYKEFKDILSKYNYKVIAFYRHPVDSLFSSYNQMVKRHFFKESITTFSLKAINENKPILMGKTLLEWNKTHESFSVFPYSSELTGKRSVIAKFLNFIGITVENLDEQGQSKRINSSYTPALLEVKRLLNFALSESDKKLNEKLDVIFQALSETNDFDNQTLATFINPKIIHLLDNSFQDSIQQLQKELNLELNASYKTKNQQAFSSFLNLQNMMKAIEQLKIQHVVIYHKLRKKIEVSSLTKASSQDKHRLYELFDISVAHIEDSQQFFSSKVIKKLPSLHEVDLYRELSIVFKNRGDFKTAEAFIDKALELRPSGPVIKKIKQSLQKLNATEIN